MSSTLIVGPPGSGKTRRILELARRRAAASERVTIIALPQQRADLLRRLGETPTLGVRVTDLQTLLYEVLEELGGVARIASVPARVAMVGAALRELYGEAAPGEAALYAGTLAELRRSGFEEVPVTGGRYQQRLREVDRVYRRLLGERGLIDLDDVRRLAALALEGGARWSDPPQHLMVDGYQAFNRMERRTLAAMAGSALSLTVSLPGLAPAPWTTRTPPEDLEALRRDLRIEKVEKLRAGAAPRFRLHAASSPSRELRDALAEVKICLQQGVDPHELALIVPDRAAARALLELGREYGLPLHDEHAASVLDTPQGRRFELLLGVRGRGYPPRDLLALASVYPGLELVAEALERRGLSGSSPVAALEALPVELAPLRDLLRETESPAPSLEAWLAYVERLMERAGCDRQPEAPELRVVAREVYALLPEANPAALIDWTRALLADLPAPRRSTPGVAVLEAEQASGRRFARTWLLGAQEGRYTLDESEEFFYSEEDRTLLGLERRMRGLASSVLYDALWRAPEVAVSYARSERGGERRAHRLLEALEAEPRPGAATTASPLELARLRPPPPETPPRYRRLEALRERRAWELARYAPCRLRGYLEGRVRPAETRPVYAARDREAARRKARQAAWSQQELPAQTDPAWAPGFRERVLRAVRRDLPPRPDLEGLVILGVLPLGEMLFRPHAHRLLRRGRLETLEVYLIGTGVKQLRDHRESMWLAAQLRASDEHRGLKLDFYAWDLQGEREPLHFTAGDLERAREELSGLRAALEAGDYSPVPGFHCRSCRFGDVCRET
ncbi:hypothetical protein HNR42_002147 [Deinobacterium chartae]|uniref:DNA helicase n=1 Tax=Deinobacterium chartae TaxID=521158 RepID=A0A841I3X9_9DEIO|nr:hypothetical protein [Deinobacterium chartae]MBB6098712.1 hypothetical protein [Deinobacterium chartae]